MVARGAFHLARSKAPTRKRHRLISTIVRRDRVNFSVRYNNYNSGLNDTVLIKVGNKRG